MPRPTWSQPNRPRRSTKNPSHDGEGVLVRADYSNRPSGHCNGRSAAADKNFSDDDSPPRPFILPTPGEKARRIAELRIAMADAAPLFQARIRREQEGGRS